MFIYKLTSPSGNSYVGQTKHNIEKRWKQHVSSWQNWQKDKSRNGVSTKLYFAFDKYPPKDWTKEILCECSTKQELNEKEIFYIAEFGHYNMTKGGDGRIVDFFEEDHKENISKSRKEFFETEEGKVWKGKLSENFSGKNNPMYGNGELISKQNSKWYLIVDRENNEQIIKNLYQFRKDNKGKTIKTFPDEYPSAFCKPCDFRCVLIEGYSDVLEDGQKKEIITESKKYIKPIKQWKILSPTGIVYITDSLNNFCDENPHLTPQLLGGVALGKYKDHKGWKSQFYDP